MRNALFILALCVGCSVTFGDSLLFTLEEKVRHCSAVLRVSLKEVQPPKSTNSPLDQVCVCKATVLETFTGPKHLQELEFRFNPYTRSKLPSVGQECFVFLHEPRDGYWLFEGPFGIRPLAKEYYERRISPKGELVEETFSHSNFVAALRRFASGGH
jgi:hypothetical protein